ncbi:ABC transporter G family member 9-like protein [Cinnamomum micranthum f. kanehirae]|uniref:ABC transporter G family member 9-like protein n=1 Tax=Cinnamomum micranthum f. kanehirae TaxID=337451 RepID=A0A3S3PUS9_9MAGN|nr:ABC transporter G family member 9-like protein [Cinnamomum micranthum f. kanehirae]
MGAFIKYLKSAVTLGSVITLSSNLVGGYYVQHIPAFIAWAKYLSISHHTYKLLVGTQYTSDQTYMCGPNTECLVRDFPSVKAVGLDKNWVSVLILCAMVVGFRLIAYIGLMGIGVKKDKTPSRLASLNLLYRSLITWFHIHKDESFYISY